MKLPRFVACIVRLFTATIDQAPMSPIEKERLTYFAVFVFLGVIAMSIYGAYNLAIGDLLLTTIIFSSGSGLILGWLLMCHLPLGKWVYRVSAVVYGSLLLYIFFLGGDNGSKSLWLFTFPLITLFLMGKNEGLAWSVILLVVAFALILFPGLQPFRYGNEFLARLATVYLIITSVAYWYEHFHEHYRRGMEVESTRLKGGDETLSDPICLQDGKGRTILSNPACNALAGMNAGQLTGDQKMEPLIITEGEKEYSTLTLSLKEAGSDAYSLLIGHRNPSKRRPALWQTKRG